MTINILLTRHNSVGMYIVLGFALLFFGKTYYWYINCSCIADWEMPISDIVKLISTIVFKSPIFLTNHFFTVKDFADVTFRLLPQDCIFYIR